MKKCLYSLLFFFFSLSGLCFFPTSVSALETITPVATRRIPHFNFSKSNDLTFYGTAFEDSGRFKGVFKRNDASVVSSLYGARFSLDSPLDVHSGERASFTMLFTVSIERYREYPNQALGFSDDYLTSSFLCPSNNSDFLVRNCDVQVSQSSNLSVSDFQSSNNNAGYFGRDRFYSFAVDLDVEFVRDISNYSTFTWSDDFLYFYVTSSNDYVDVDIFYNYMSFYDLDDSTTNATEDVNQTLKDQAQEEKDAANKNQNDLSSSSDSSQDNVDSATQSLFSVITGFIGVLTSATPSNCNLDMDFGFFDGGSANLCTGGSNSIVSVVGTIMLIGFCIPLCWSAISKMISLFRSFQT